MYKILVVDDDIELTEMLNNFFSRKGYDVIQAADGTLAIELIKEKPDIILLDVNMPGMDGLKVCCLIRDKVSCPIIFLTAKIDESDRIIGLMSGGDDYITKPFCLKELEARITAHLNREERHKHQALYHFKKGLWVDYNAKTVNFQNHTLGFTKSEFLIIEVLSLNAGQVFDKERIYEKVFGFDGEGDSRSITELVRRIRKKISAITETEYIETVWGMGYKWKS